MSLNSNVSDAQDKLVLPIKFNNKPDLYGWLDSIDYDRYKVSKLNAVYMLVKYMCDNEEVIEPIYFSKMGDGYSESDCLLCEVRPIYDDNDLEDYVKRIYSFDSLDDALKYEKELCRDGKLYDIEGWQCNPFLPDEIEIIQIMMEGECLDYLLKSDKDLSSRFKA